jgi:hypothetical protein
MPSRWRGGHHGRGGGARTPSGGGNDEHVAPPTTGREGERGVCDSPWRRSSHHCCVRPRSAVGVTRRRGSPWRSHAGGVTLEVTHRGGPPSRWSAGGGCHRRRPAPSPGRRGGARGGGDRPCDPAPPPGHATLPDPDKRGLREREREREQNICGDKNEPPCHATHATLEIRTRHLNFLIVETSGDKACVEESYCLAAPAHTSGLWR